MQAFSIEEFAAAERGETDFALETFSEEMSVQDQSFDAIMNTQPKSSSSGSSLFGKYAESFDASALDMDLLDPNNDGSRLFDSFDDELSGGGGNLFASFSLGGDEPAAAPSTASAVTAVQFPDVQDLPESTGGFQEMSLGGATLSLDDVSLPPSQREFLPQSAPVTHESTADFTTPAFTAHSSSAPISEDMGIASMERIFQEQADAHEAAMQAAETARQELQQNLDTQTQALEKATGTVATQAKEIGEQVEALKAKDVELMALQRKVDELEKALPAQVETARQESFTNGFTQGFSQGKEAEVQRSYDASKADYMELLEKSWTGVLDEVKKYDEAVHEIDAEMPEIVLAYLREIVGTERKLNDKFVTNLIQTAIKKITDKQHMVFNINPADADVVTEAFPQYGVALDPIIPKGAVRIQTTTGNVDLSVDAWLDSLSKQIHEQLKTA
jgi:flagellar biosynthesis/type III secretory pathway protein FliH